MFSRSHLMIVKNIILKDLTGELYSQCGITWHWGNESQHVTLPLSPFPHSVHRPSPSQYPSLCQQLPQRRGPQTQWAGGGVLSRRRWCSTVTLSRGVDSLNTKVWLSSNAMPPNQLMSCLLWSTGNYLYVYIITTVFASVDILRNVLCNREEYPVKWCGKSDHLTVHVLSNTGEPM